MSLSDDLDAMARAQSRREAAAREASAVAPRRGRHRAPTPPLWALRPTPRHQRRVATPPTVQAVPPQPPPAEAAVQRPAPRTGTGDLELLLASNRWEVVRAHEPGFTAPRRLEVAGDLTAAALLVALGEMTTLPVADWAPQRTAGWDRYAVDVRVTGLGAGGGAGLRVRVGRVGEVAAVLSAGVLVLERGVSARSSHPLTGAADERSLRLDVEPGWVTASVDGREVARVPALDGDHEPRVVASAGADGVVATAGSLGVVARRATDGTFPRLVGLSVTAPEA